MKKPLIIIIMALFCGSQAHAQETPSATLADGTPLAMTGAGVYRDLGEEIYVGAVYLTLLDFTIKPELSKKMEMRISAPTLSARRFTGLWTDAITLSSTRDERSANVEQIQEFSRLFRENLQLGDRISFDYVASAQSTVISHNGVQIGALSGAAFHSILLNAWIGSTPVNAQLKAGILNQLPPADRETIARKFVALDFSESRADEIAQRYGDKEAGVLGTDAPVVAGQGDLAIADASSAEDAVRREEEAQRKEAARQNEEARRTEEARQKALEEARLAEEMARQVAEAVARHEAEQRAAEQRAAEEKARFDAEQEQLAKDYRVELVRWLTGFVEYPERALARGVAGRVELDIVADREGKVLQGEITVAGNPLLDQAALKMLEKAAPLPRMPEALVGDTFSFTMPVTFAL